MSERHNHFTGPELSPEDAHRLITEDLHDAAEYLWQPGKEQDTYTSTRSAAGRQLCAALPQAEHIQDAPRLEIVVFEPSRYLFNAFSNLLGYEGRGDVASFTVLDPQEAAHTQRLGVVCALSDVNPRPDCDPFIIETGYALFGRFMDVARLCQPASTRQRLGRWAMDAFADWMRLEAKIAEGGGRPPGMFGP